MKKALIVTGIGDETHHLERATTMWPERYDIEPIIHVFGWEGLAADLDDRSAGLQAHADEIGADAVIGVSAGASAAAWLAAENSNLSYVNVCGRLHQEGNNIYKFDKYRLRAPMFVSSVERAERLVHVLDPAKSFVYWAHLDELVPKKAAIVEGVSSRAAPLPSHRLGIYSVLRFRGYEISQVVNKGSHIK